MSHCKEYELSFVCISLNNHIIIICLVKAVDLNIYILSYVKIFGMEKISDGSFVKSKDYTGQRVKSKGEDDAVLN
jgi:hypothetical protein